MANACSFACLFLMVAPCASFCACIAAERAWCAWLSSIASWDTSWVMLALQGMENLGLELILQRLLSGHNSRLKLVIRLRQLAFCVVHFPLHGRNLQVCIQI